MDGEEDEFFSGNQSDDGGATPVQDEHLGSDGEEDAKEHRSGSEADSVGRHSEVPVCVLSQEIPLCNINIARDIINTFPSGCFSLKNNDATVLHKYLSSLHIQTHGGQAEPSDAEGDEPPGQRNGIASDSENEEVPRPRDSDSEKGDESSLRRGSDSEPDEPPRHVDSHSDGEESPKNRGNHSEDEEEPKRQGVDSENEEEPKPVRGSDSESEAPAKRQSCGSDAEGASRERGSDSENEAPRHKRRIESDDEADSDKENDKAGKTAVHSDSENDEETKGAEKEEEEAEGHKRRKLADSDEEEDQDKPVKRKKAILSDSEDEEKEESSLPKKSRVVSEGEHSDSDSSTRAVPKKPKTLGSDSEEEEGEGKEDAGKKDEKALFGSDSDSDNEEEKMIADIFGESGDEEEEEFTGFNQEDLEGDKSQAEASSRKKTSTADSDSDDDVDRGGKDSSFVSDFDMMLAKKKAQSGKRRRNRDGGTFISDADDVVSAMITKMTEAAEEDRTLNTQKKPALKKLTLLPTVVMHLKKQDLKETFIDSGVMTAIKEWISPLPDKSLPALRIREELLKILQELPSVSQETLKHSGIGRAVMYLYKHPKESRANKDLALKLINEWSRPIFGLTSNYKGMTREERQQRDLDQQVPPRRRLSSGGQTPRRDLEKVLTGEEKALRPGDPGFCARARVPMPSNKDYVVRPKWNVDAETNRYQGPAKKGLSRVDKQMRRFADIKRLTKTAHAVKISVEGNRMPL
uniref:Interacts with SUPT6H, CTD assembly factor 1 n=1 Tax=Lepisosteus oculatus TaxID=7918 RepID=W5MRM1_LEPOC